MSDGAPGIFAFALVVLTSLDHMSLLTLYFMEEVVEYGTFVEIGDKVDGVVSHEEYIDEMLAMGMSQIDGIICPKLVSPVDLFGVSSIKVAEKISTTPTPKLSKDAMVVDDLFEGTIGPVGRVFDLWTHLFPLMFYRDLFLVLTMFMILHLWI